MVKNNLRKESEGIVAVALPRRNSSPTYKAEVGVSLRYMMNVKENLKSLWNYLIDNFEMEEIEAGFASAIEGFNHNVDQINDEYIDYISEEDAKGLFFDVGYMSVNELFGGDFGTWYDVLEGNLGFDVETVKFLDF